MTLSKYTLMVCCLLAACLPLVIVAQTSSTSLSPDQKAVVETIEEALQAAEAGNLQAFRSHLTPGFYMFDGGKRFDAAGIIAYLKQHGPGTSFEWHVVNPDVHIEGKTAWIAYLNDGSIKDAAGTTKLQWLESAFLVNESGTWRVAFRHSARVQGSTPVRGSQ